MYGRADGMPSFQLTVAVCVKTACLHKYILPYNSATDSSAACNVTVEEHLVGDTKLSTPVPPTMAFSSVHINSCTEFPSLT